MNGSNTYSVNSVRGQNNRCEGQQTKPYCLPEGWCNHNFHCNTFIIPYFVIVGTDYSKDVISRIQVGICGFPSRSGEGPTIIEAFHYIGVVVFTGNGEIK